MGEVAAFSVKSCPPSNRSHFLKCRIIEVWCELLAHPVAIEWQGNDYELITGINCGNDCTENIPKAAHLWVLPGARERLELVKGDLLVEGSYDAAVEGCQGVFHTAASLAIINQIQGSTISIEKDLH